jgi:hypothetical protein
MEFQQTERELQGDIVEALRMLPGVDFVIHIPINRYSGRRQMERAGVVPGTPDLLVISGDRLLWIEIKTPVGQLRPAQKVFKDHCYEAGTPWCMARSLDGAVAAVVAWRSGGSQDTITASVIEAEARS